MPSIKKNVNEYSSYGNDSSSENIAEEVADKTSQYYFLLVLVAIRGKHAKHAKHAQPKPVSINFV